MRTLNIKDIAKIKAPDQKIEKLLPFNFNWNDNATVGAVITSLSSDIDFSNTVNGVVIKTIDVQIFAKNTSTGFYLPNTSFSGLFSIQGQNGVIIKGGSLGEASAGFRSVNKATYGAGHNDGLDLKFEGLVSPGIAYLNFLLDIYVNQAPANTNVYAWVNIQGFYY